LLDALSSLANDATQSAHADSAIDDLLQQTAVCRAHMHTCAERVGILRARALDEWRAAESMHRHITSGNVNASSTTDYLLHAVDQHSSMLTVYGEQIVALEQLISAKLTSSNDKSTSVSSWLCNIRQCEKCVQLFLNNFNNSTRPFTITNE
jgi:hypothetical protein